MSEKIYEAALGLLKLATMKSRSFNAGRKIKKSIFQTKVLEAIFAKTSLPSTPTQLNIALLLKIPQRSVQIWFQNARQTKKRKQYSTELYRPNYDNCEDLFSDESNALNDLEDDVCDMKVEELLTIINEISEEVSL